ncbi:Pus7 [Symbiodinium natans]|uniref:Pus7 protein n=1 Tax=Symbiodinium natans TaxID=878477 RepID=A0A812RK08_9DINO|nr:Pus7 [Symbiodinium natans]
MWLTNAHAHREPLYFDWWNMVWAAVLYSVCSVTTEEASPRQRLAAALGVPDAALRLGPALHLPGVAVELARLPRGLPESLEPSAELQAGIFAREGGDSKGSKSSLPDLALGPPDHAQSLALWEEMLCPAHRYTIVLRNLSEAQVSRAAYDHRLEEIRDKGFANFFELSSFGLAEVRRYEIGAALWCGHWDRACQLLLTSNRGGSSLAAASAAFASRDYAQGLEKLPTDASCKGLRALAMHLLLKRDPLEALRRALPVPLWGKLLAAVGRVCWNRAAAARLRGLAHQPLVGDLIWDEKAGEPRPLSAQDVQSGRWQLSDIVLPLPRPGESLHQGGQRLGMEAELQELVPDQDAPAGCFPLDVSKILPPVRRIVSIPSDLSWDVVESSGGSAVDCDLARLSERGLPVTMSTRRPRAASGLVLRLRCTLPRAESAEALLRELTAANPSEFRENLSRRDNIF